MRASKPKGLNRIAKICYIWFQYDSTVIIKSEPLVLDGGYDQWLLYYPQLTTNSNITRPKTDLLSSIPSCMYIFLYLNLCSRLFIFFNMASKTEGLYQYCDRFPLSWSWSHGSWICTYLCNQCLSLLTLRVRIPLRRGVLDTTLCDKVCLWLAVVFFEYAGYLHQ